MPYQFAHSAGDFLVAGSFLDDRVDYLAITTPPRNEPWRRSTTAFHAVRGHG